MIGLPERGDEQVLTFSVFRKQVQIISAIYDDNTWWLNVLDSDTEEILEHVTHWAEMPELPKQDDGTE